MIAAPPFRRRTGLLTLAALAGCSVLPERPFQEPRRFALAPARPVVAPPAPRGPVLLVRSFRAAPGLELRGLRRLDADGRVETEYWNEWTAPPADLVEEALRRWLEASGRFAAVIAPGSRLRPDLVLEGELVTLQAEAAGAIARARLSLLLLTEGGAETRVLAPLLVEATAPLPPGAPGAAAAMGAALAEALARAEAEIVGIAAARRGDAPARTGR